MKGNFIYYSILCLFLLPGCSSLNEDDVEGLLKKNQLYPTIVETKIFCNSDGEVSRVIDTGLVRDGFVTAQLKHTPDDIGRPLIYFTNKATPYLLPTSDTLKTFDEQKVKVADEHFLRVVNIEISASGDKAVIDYLTEMKDITPFAVLYRHELSGMHPRRTFFTKKGEDWEWDGKIVKMPRK